ncbi:hypothetical protein CHX27_11380 [Flavobacterium aurantiibacter]|uniref:Uncharacterized protein n=2 Tax=Flavobacterium aurantiibacter TaxID=2023067 RepID=A0A255ZKG2_9FLAO|nr:hypothetical protein CHX27_12545 [Flavobacterium aurantiibacter]OYQ42892.1 hypothetical protein CHX27_11380 [Flavobacterium aurantiibacter]
MLFYVKKTAINSGPFTPFIWLIGFSTFYEYFITHLLYTDAYYWFQIYPFLSFLAIHYFFNNLLKPKYQKLFKWLFIGFIAVYICSLFVWINKSTMYLAMAINRTYITLFIFLSVALWFRKLMDDLKDWNLWHNPNFYFILSLTLYYASTLFLFLASNFILKSSLQFTSYWQINAFAGIFFRLLIGFGIWKMKTD